MDRWTRGDLLDRVAEERFHQTHKWGPEHDRKHTPEEWKLLIEKYTQKACFPDHGCLPSKAFEENMIIVASLAIAAVEATKDQ